jgi:hypothetical protein
VSSDGRGLVSQAGAVLLWETMRATGLGRGLSQGLSRWRAPRAVHDPGKVVADLTAAVALGGDCLADIAVLREQPELAGPVASDPVVSRLVTALAAEGPRALKAMGAGRAERSRRGRRPGDGRPGRDDRDRPFGERPGQSHLEAELADLELRHRRRARCEDRIRNAKGHRAAEPPLKGYAQNQVWCEIVALACELLAWTQMVALAGEARRWEPKRLGLRLFSIAGRLVCGGRRLRLRLAERWPWAGQLTDAIARLQALPVG